MKYKVLAFLFACVAMTSCVDDIESYVDDNEMPEFFTDGYALNLTVTLDNMGGTRVDGDVTDSYDANRLKELENYIDPEKFRILFFDREERFLFESKSRWVKQLQSVVSNDQTSFSQWLVSVPLYDYGNDEKEHWKWDEIRKVLTGEDMDEDIRHYNSENNTFTSGYKSSYLASTVKAALEAEKKGEQTFAFKIAILVNRPNMEWNMGINGRYAKSADGDDILVYDPAVDKEVPIAPITPGGWSITNGPDWNVDNTRWGAEEQDRKTVFDLHHCQYDPIYHGKSYSDRMGTVFANDPGGRWEYKGREDYVQGSNPPRKFTDRTKDPYWYYNYQVYDFVEKPKGGNQLLGGATSTWVDWSNNDAVTRSVTIKAKTNSTESGQRKDVTTGYRKYIPLSQDHPIPMYGIQNFNKIRNWTKGTPFNLSEIIDGEAEDDYDYKSISLLRSVVKLELILPNEPEWVLMWYSNVYARCEPMDVWTPTDELWEGEDHKGKEHPSGETGNTCEWYNIVKYGAVSRSGDPTTDTKTEDESVTAYQQRLSWFYGVWDEDGPDGQPRWDFQGSGFKGTIGDDAPSEVKRKYPRIFNSCIQRNATVYCDKDLMYIENGLYHYVVYTGERNMNDPATITNIGNDGNGAPTICYWMVKFPNNDNVYSIAFADHQETGTPTYRILDIYHTDVNNKSNKLKSDMSPYEKAVQSGSTKPWPLMRNHVYRITVTSVNGTRSGEGGTMDIKTETFHSKSLKAE